MNSRRYFLALCCAIGLIFFAIAVVGNVSEPSVVGYFVGPSMFFIGLFSYLSPMMRKYIYGGDPDDWIARDINDLIQAWHRFLDIDPGELSASDVRYYERESSDTNLFAVIPLNNTPADAPHTSDDTGSFALAYCCALPVRKWRSSARWLPTSIIISNLTDTSAEDVLNDICSAIDATEMRVVGRVSKYYMRKQIHLEPLVSWLLPLGLTAKKGGTPYY